MHHHVNIKDVHTYMYLRFRYENINHFQSKKIIDFKYHDCDISNPQFLCYFKNHGPM